MFLEAFCTFMFVSAILLVKDAESGRFVAQIAGEGINFFGCGLIALSLTGMILVCGPHTSASLNPAVSVAQTVLDIGLIGKDDTQDFFRVYVLGPILGAIVAGLFSWGHSVMLQNHAPLRAAPLEEERKPLMNDEENSAPQKQD